MSLRHGVEVSPGTILVPVSNELNCFPSSFDNIPAFLEKRETALKLGFNIPEEDYRGIALPDNEQGPPCRFHEIDPPQSRKSCLLLEVAPNQITRVDIKLLMKLEQPSGLILDFQDKNYVPEECNKYQIILEALSDLDPEIGASNTATQQDSTRHSVRYDRTGKFEHNGRRLRTNNSWVEYVNHDGRQDTVSYCLSLELDLRVDHVRTLRVFQGREQRLVYYDLPHAPFRLSVLLGKAVSSISCRHISLTDATPMQGWLYYDFQKW
ncbi:hypothetical protein BLNAU_11796 [Blattamonas nauphoetae]|uniref:Uncharacterized protein n=1 Tax=Blattamonas nauphoetae TaxID=2049346 RepID=A0ABQ9XLN5_9EUKA|nr:hypothetical protein BLNAU_11796 [Blattamonas nauphoetae]